MTIGPVGEPQHAKRTPPSGMRVRDGVVLGLVAVTALLIPFLSAAFGVRGDPLKGIAALSITGCAGIALIYTLVSAGSGGTGFFEFKDGRWHRLPTREVSC